PSQHRHHDCFHLTQQKNPMKNCDMNLRRHFHHHHHRHQHLLPLPFSLSGMVHFVTEAEEATEATAKVSLTCLEDQEALRQIMVAKREGDFSKAISQEMKISTMLLRVVVILVAIGSVGKIEIDS